MNRVVTLSHGSGGKQALDLIRQIFAGRFKMKGHLTDSAILQGFGVNLAFTTDSFVVDPLFFPGGNIGKLAVCGTVNDLAVSGADPKFISASFIIEEGFAIDELDAIAASMAEEAEQAGVKIVTGDTKVVERGKCDKLFINTSGIGFLDKNYKHISTGDKIRPGDKLIINGPLGNHSVAILGARNKLSFSTPVLSDCASLNGIIKKVLLHSTEIRFMRDLTRGGLVAVLNELAGMINSGITINEPDIPVDEAVRALCEMMGFDPLFLANEGKVLFIAGEKDQVNVLNALRSEIPGRNSAVIGEITDDRKGMIVLNTVTGGKRLLDMPSGLQLPRIC